MFLGSSDFVEDPRLCDHGADQCNVTTACEVTERSKMD
jgi:hypothetical protein